MFCCVVIPILMAYAYELISIKDNRRQEFINLLIVAVFAFSLSLSSTFDWMTYIATSCFAAHLDITIFSSSIQMCITWNFRVLRKCNLHTRICICTRLNHNRDTLARYHRYREREREGAIGNIFFAYVQHGH